MRRFITKLVNYRTLEMLFLLLRGWMPLIRRPVTKIVNYRKYRMPEMLLIFLLGWTPLLWFKTRGLLLDPDSNFGLDPLKRFLDRLYAWNYTFQSGTDASGNFATIFHSGLGAAFNQVFDLPTTERLMYVALFMLPGFSMYFLASQILRRNRWARVAATVAALFYMFNFYQAYIWPRLHLGSTALILVPIILGMLIKWFRNELTLPRDLLVLGFITLIIAPIGVQPPLIGALLITLFAYFVFHNIIERKGLKGWILSFSKLVSLLLVFILCSAFWLIPVANFTINSGYLNPETAQEVFATSLLVDWTSVYTNFVNVFRLQGDVAWFGSWADQPYSLWFNQYQTNIFLIALSFLFPILAFSALFRKDKFALFFSILSAVAIMLSMGVHPPFSAIFLWLFDNIPGFWVFRAPWQKFTIMYIISFSILLAITCSNISHWLTQSLGRRKLTLQRYAPPLLIMSVVSLNIFYMWPFITGATFPTSEGDYGYHEHFNVGYHHETIPSYLFDSANWINRQEEKFNIFLLPDDKVGVYNWGYASIQDVTTTIFNKGLLFRQYGEGIAPPHSVDAVYMGLAANLYAADQKNTAKFLGFINTKYILQRNDFWYDFYNDTDSPSFIREQLSTQEGLNFERSIGEWDFYRIPDEYFFPHIYGATNAALSPGGIDDMLRMVNRETFQLSNSIILLSDQAGSNPIDYSATEAAGSIVLWSEQERGEAKYSTETSVARSEDGSLLPFSWDNQPINSFTIRYYEGWKDVITTNGEEEVDTITFASSSECPYVFPEFVDVNNKAWGAIDAALAFVQTGDAPLTIISISEEGEIVPDIVGIWWESGCVGMGLEPISYPLTIPANEKAILQINHKPSQLAFETLRHAESYISLKSNPREIRPEITFKEINPTEYKVNITASQPFWLVFSEPYNRQWKASVDNKPFEFNNLVATYDNLQVREMKRGQTFNPLAFSYLFAESLPDDQHYTVNGYANAWYIDPDQIEKDEDGTFTVTLFFMAQSLFYLGLGISALTLLALISWVLWKRRTQRLVRHIPSFSPDEEEKMI